MKKQSGFTLIELLLVLAIIGIIAAIAIPALLGQRERAKAKAVQSMVANVAGELARVNDTLKENSSNASAVTAAVVRDAVLTLSNFKYPAAKNPYGGSGQAYTATSPAKWGQIGLVATQNFSDTATGRRYPAVVVRGQFKDPKDGATAYTTKVVALD